MAKNYNLVDTRQNVTYDRALMDQYYGSHAAKLSQRADTQKLKDITGAVTGRFLKGAADLPADIAGLVPDTLRLISGGKWGDWGAYTDNIAKYREATDKYIKSPLEENYMNKYVNNASRAVKNWNTYDDVVTQMAGGITADKAAKGVIKGVDKITSKDYKIAEAESKVAEAENEVNKLQKKLNTLNTPDFVSAADKPSKLNKVKGVATTILKGEQRTEKNIAKTEKALKEAQVTLDKANKSLEKIQSKVTYKDKINDIATAMNKEHSTINESLKAGTADFKKPGRSTEAQEAALKKLMQDPDVVKGMQERKYDEIAQDLINRGELNVTPTKDQLATDWKARDVIKSISNNTNTSTKKVNELINTIDNESKAARAAREAEQSADLISSSDIRYGTENATDELIKAIEDIKWKYPNLREDMKMYSSMDHVASNLGLTPNESSKLGKYIAKRSNDVAKAREAQSAQEQLLESIASYKQSAYILEQLDGNENLAEIVTWLIKNGGGNNYLADPETAAIVVSQAARNSKEAFKAVELIKKYNPDFVSWTY